jgi:hypothetical protein
MQTMTRNYSGMQVGHASKSMRMFAVAAGLTGAILIAGCGIGPDSAPAVPAEVPGVTLHGIVHGGQQAVVGSTIKLYAAGATNYGVGATYTTGTGNLLTTGVTSVAGGAFTISGLYTCPSASTPVYIVATGGNSGYSSNTDIALMTALGPCGNLSTSTFITINEVTTVASVYALSSFMTGIPAIGTSPANSAGLTSAFADVNLLASTSTGFSPGTMPVGTTVPYSEINTLANILAACVNSAGGTYNDGSSCGTLFYNANPGTTSATAPADTLTAIMDIAQNPAVSTAKTMNLFNLSTGTAPFQPTLSAQPNDFTIAVNFTGGNLSAPSALAADASGNIWIANQGNSTVTELAHSGAILSGPGGYTASFNSPSAIAFDTDGSVWITNKVTSTVSRLNSSGGEITSYGGGGLSSPTSSSGSYNNYTPAGSSTPIGIAVTPH